MQIENFKHVHINIIAVPIGILASASPVWRKMFTSDFKEKAAREISLPGKKFDEMHELLLCISPAIQKPITGILSYVGKLWGILFS